VAYGEFAGGSKQTMCLCWYQEGVLQPSADWRITYVHVTALRGVACRDDRFALSLRRCSCPLNRSTEHCVSFSRQRDRLSVAKLSKSGVSDNVPEGSTLISGDTVISLQHR